MQLTSRKRIYGVSRLNVRGRGNYVGCITVLGVFIDAHIKNGMNIHKTFKGFPEEIYPIMLGHEGVSEVVEIGTDVKGLKPGDKVLLPFVDPDQELYGDLGSGWGAMSEYAVVHHLLAYAPG